MIVEWLLDAIQAVLIWGLTPLPTHTLGFVSKLGLLANNLTALNYFLPITETFAIVLGVVFLWPIFFGVNFVVWCIALIRGGSARG